MKANFHNFLSKMKQLLNSKCNKTGANWNNIFEGKYNNAKCNSIEITWTNSILSNMLQRCAALKTLS